ncbi:hypothetical protein JET76_21110 [Pseudomonas putida]|uniref:Uncharacterized protein n=1 Tax=Pseudomonas putida TaxID=303 RepID=A0A7W2QKL5_PSEPU|nr:MULTISPECIES: DUF6021 family protein [Pseudomonas]MBA6118120.1 hypothetical protein [Pseudomonas putida]MBI6943834.1 hypothetical protein [Pseudomonas putida]MBI6959920.1 hypothetical protein [Pseudomonas putida]MCZ9639733.1 DUF6021 family protein [Pseudomonas putida]MEC4878557.1 DUF6021 family protein [Pseudomonas sp. NC26]
MTKPTQQPEKGQGPHSSDKASKNHELGFDPDSPDLDDPQVDPTGPAIAPRDEEKKHK